MRQPAQWWSQPGAVERAALVLLFITLAFAASPAAALGPGAPPVLHEPAVWRNAFVTDAVADPPTTSPQLIARVAVEIPSGSVPSNISSVTVQVPAGGTFAMFLDRRDFLQRDYSVNLTEAGVATFPTGDYIFTVSDTGGGITMATRTVSSFAALTPTSAITVSGATTSQSGAVEGTLQPAVVLLVDDVATPAPLISWSPVGGAVAYRVRVQHVGSGYESFDFTVPAATTSLTLPPRVLTSGRRYTLLVDATDAIGLGTSSGRAQRETDLLVLGPIIELSILGGTGAGQTLTVVARVANPGPTLNMDVQGFIHIPGGGALPILELNAVAIVHTPNGDFFNGPIFSHTFASSEPDGLYLVRLVFRDSATKETVAVATKAFSR